MIGGRRTAWLLALISLCWSPHIFAQGESTPSGMFTIARLQYGGGGDWYSDPSSLPNLLRFIRDHTRVAVTVAEERVQLLDKDLFSYPYLYLTGHGNVAFDDREVERLRRYLESGGFLHADDNYGLDESFRREMKRAFPFSEWVELTPEHEIFHSHFNFYEGLPKIHEHDGKRPQLLGLFIEDRLAVVYSYESDLGDGWEDAEVHQVPADRRLAALRMGANIVLWALSH
ncbi:MAG: DUF4159 domain-containing protein [Candidatus Latescibacterota bacterium]